MPAPQAAHYIGVSVSKLRTLPIARRILGGKRVYDKADLDAYADSLPYEGEQEDGWDTSEADRAFGCRG